MSAQNPQSQGVLGAIAGMLGFSVLAGVLATVMVTPALALTSVAASNGIAVFEGLPEDLNIGDQPQENKIIATNAAGEDVVIATVYSQNREEVGWDEVSQFVKDATVAGEDRRFYEHGGVDIQGVIRAALKNTVSGGVESGASTLSMQFVKNVYIQRALQFETEEERDKALKEAQKASFDRKLKEMKLAIGLEKKYTKDEILLAYLNIAGFGGNTYGIEAAAQRYYGVTAADLNLAQAASLIAIVQQPGARSLDNPDNYKANQDRRDHILAAMLAEEMIDKSQYDEAIATPVDEETVDLQPPTNGCIAADPEPTRQFCDYIVKSVKDLEALGTTEEERLENWKVGGYSIYTTLNLELQALAQKTLRTYAPPKETRLRLGASSIMLEVGTGKILVMAQNKGFDDTADGNGNAYTALNFNTDEPYGGSRGFQVGSTYKVFTLLNWLQSGHGLNEVVQADARTENQASFTDSCGGPWGGPWKFRNDSGEKGTRTVMAATAQSVNGAYVSMALKLDLCQTKKIAESLGVHTAIRTDNPKTTGVTDVENELNTNPSSILGTNDIAPMSIATAYAALANKGTMCKPIAVLKVIDAHDVELEGQEIECQPSLIDADIAAGAVWALQGAMNGYVANPRDGIPHMGKTGTTNSSKQTWVVNSSSKVTTVTWVGNIKGDFPMRNYYNAHGAGGNLRHLISHVIMKAADKIYGGSKFPAPPAKALIGTGIKLDNFVGQTLENAKSIIEARGLLFKDGGEVDSDQPVGLIAKTSPGAGTILASGMTVTVYTSNGSMSTLPDVVTGNPTPGSAQGTLSGAGFDNVTQYCVVTADPLLVDRVLETDPPPGTVYRRDNEVKLGVGALAC